MPSSDFVGISDLLEEADLVLWIPSLFSPLELVMERLVLFGLVLVEEFGVGNGLSLFKICLVLLTIWGSDALNAVCLSSEEVVAAGAGAVLESGAGASAVLDTGAVAGAVLETGAVEGAVLDTGAGAGAVLCNGAGNPFLISEVLVCLVTIWLECLFVLVT